MQTLCGALCRDGHLCRNDRMPNGRCRMHGGATPTGAALPQFHNGRYSRHLPERLAERYHEAASDPDLLALREDIALLDTRLANLLLRLELDEGHDATWTTIGDALEQRRKLVESEHKRLTVMQQMITAEQAMTFLAAVVNVVRRHVHDRSILAGISADLAQLAVRSSSHSPHAHQPE